MVYLAFTILFQSASWASPDFSEEPDVLGAMDGELALRFADHLLDENDPFNALTYYRLGQFLSGGPQPGAALRVAWCYERGERWDAAEEAYLRVSERFPSVEGEALWRAAMVARRAGRGSLARVYLQDLELLGGAWADRARWMRAMITIELGEGMADEFLAFQAEFPESPFASRVPAVRIAMDAPYRKTAPWVAGAMSAVVPGLGQAWVGHWGDGAMSFLTTAGTGALAYTLVHYGREADARWAMNQGVAWGTLSVFFWASETFGAVRGAKRANHQRWHLHLEEVSAAGIGPELEVEPLTVDTTRWPNSLNKPGI